MRSRTAMRIVMLVAAVIAAQLVLSGSALGAKRSSNVSGDQVARLASTFKGSPYRWGASGPRAFDCSGFVAYVYGRFGYRITHSSYGQMRIGRKVSRSDLQPGDIVIWNRGGHTGLYAGKGRFISATSSRGVWTYPMSKWARWQRYTTARRLLPSKRSGSGDPAGGTGGVVADG